MILVGIGKVQFRQDAVHVLLDGPLGHPKVAGDARVRPAFRHRRENLLLPPAQRGQRVVPPVGGDQLVNQNRVDEDAAVRHPPHRLGEFAGRGARRSNQRLGGDVMGADLRR